MDWFTPYDEACIDLDDLELGSASIALLPTDSTNGAKLAIALSKQGRLFLVNTDNLGKFNAGGDNQIKEEFMVGAYTCSATTTGADADGPNWNRLYGTASYWNGNVYMGASNMALTQYQFQNGLLNSTPVAMSPTTYGHRPGDIARLRCYVGFDRALEQRDERNARRAGRRHRFFYSGGCEWSSGYDL